MIGDVWTRDILHNRVIYMDAYLPPYLLINYFVPGMGTEYCDKHVCLSVCLSVRERKSGIFCACFLLAWLSPSLAAVQYISGFVDTSFFPHGTARTAAVSWSLLLSSAMSDLC